MMTSLQLGQVTQVIKPSVRKPLTNKLDRVVDQ